MPALAVARVFKAIPALDRKPAVSTTADADPLKLNRLVQPLHSGVGAGALAVPARRLVRGLRAGPYVSAQPEHDDDQQQSCRFDHEPVSIGANRNEKSMARTCLVSAPTETKSTPVSAMSRTLSRSTPPRSEEHTAEIQS